MYERLLTFLRCPTCGSPLELEPLAPRPLDAGAELSEALLRCARDHWFPVVRGVPRERRLGWGT